MHYALRITHLLHQLRQQLLHFVSSLLGLLGVQVTAAGFEVEDVALFDIFGERGAVKACHGAVLAFQNRLFSLKSVYSKSLHYFAAFMDGLPVLTVRELPSVATMTVWSRSVR